MIQEVVNVPTTTTKTTIVEVQNLPTTTSTEYISTSNVLAPTIIEVSSGLLGPNSWGVPENFPLIPADAACHKCKGTGYKKALLTRKWKCCGKCARKYGTDKHSVKLHDIPPYHAGENVVIMEGAGATSLAGVGSSSVILPAGFQVLPANKACHKCKGTGYKKSKKHGKYQGCKVCANQYGTDLSTVVIPATTSYVGTSLY